MENNDTNTNHKLVRVEDQKWELVEITIGIIFLCLRYVFTIFYTGSFQVSTKKNYPHLTCQFPPKIPIWCKSLLYKCSEKMAQPPPHPHHHPQGVRTMLNLTLGVATWVWMSTLIKGKINTSRFFPMLHHDESSEKSWYNMATIHFALPPPLPNKKFQTPHFYQFWISWTPPLPLMWRGEQLKLWCHQFCG